MSTKQCCVALSPNYKGAIILDRDTGIELLGPGSAIFRSGIKQNACGTCEDCSEADAKITNIIILGEVKLEVLDTLAAQKKAIWRRVTWLNWLRRLQEISCPTQRIECLIQHLNIFFGREVCQSLPSAILANLLGCDEIQVLWVRDRYFQDWSWDNSPQIPAHSCLTLVAAEWQALIARTLQSAQKCPPELPGLGISSPVVQSPRWGAKLPKVSLFGDSVGTYSLWGNGQGFAI